MSRKTEIEWCDSTANPVMGCNGCELWNRNTGVAHCYAGTMTDRYAGQAGWPASFEQPTLFLDRIEKALKWSDLTGTEHPGKPHLNGYPRIIFWNDMSDGFTAGVKIDWMAEYVFLMAASPHIHIHLTKRPSRMVTFFRDVVGYVPPNFWLGTSVTNNVTAPRVKQLLKLRDMCQTLFVSAEPLLERLNPSVWDYMKAVDWLILGGESGPGKRPFSLDGARELAAYAGKHDVKFFMKQVDKVQSIPDDLLIRQMPDYAKAMPVVHQPSLLGGVYKP